MIYELTWVLNDDESYEDEIDKLESSSKIINNLIHDNKIKMGSVVENIESIDETEYIDINDYFDEWDDDKYFYSFYIEFDNSIKSIVEKEINKLQAESNNNQFKFSYKEI